MGLDSEFTTTGILGKMSEMKLKNDQPRKPRVVVIGAGISGLAAARHLHTSSKFQVTVLEGSSRIGGRICTSRFVTGEQIELGATWIHGIEGSPIYEIADKSGALEQDPVDLVPFECMDGFPEHPPLVRLYGGTTVETSISQSMAALYKHLIAEINACRGAERLEDGDCGNLGTFLRRRLRKHINKHSISLSSSIQEGVFEIQENWERCVTAADSLTDIDLDSFNEYWEFPGEQITIPCGFSSVVHAISKSLPSEAIQFGKKVSKVLWTGSPLKVYCEDGSAFEADHIIVTVSLGVLKSEALPGENQANMFEPRLPSWKLDAIRRLGYGVVDKVFVGMEQAAYHPNLQMIHKTRQKGGEDTNDVPRWMRRTHSMYPINRKSDVLVGWFAGEEAKEMEKLSDQEIAQGVQKTLTAFGDNRKVAGLEKPNGCSQTVSIMHGSWNSNPLYRGSYSYVAVGSSGEDIELLGTPVPSDRDGLHLPLLFAGEATHREQYSTTHGAYFSGVREANRLLKHYKILS